MADKSKYTPDQPKVPGADVIYRPAGEAGEYAALATNPYEGCGHKCAYCLDPETLIQMADGTTRPIKGVHIGAKIIGLIREDETKRAWSWKFVEATVLNRITTSKPALDVTLRNGQKVRCSPDHRWLTDRGWKTTDRLTINNLVRIIGPATRKFTLPGQSLCGSSQVKSIQVVGWAMEMVDITTTTENFIANGMVSHNCYVPLAMHLKRPDFDAGAVPRPGYDARLRKDVERYARAGIVDGHPADQVFITFSSDPYHPGDVEPTVRAIETLIGGGMSFCTLSKGGMKAWSYRAYYRPNRDAYAATLTTLDDDFSRKWERAAPLPSDRIEALRKFHEAGVFTWVSLEPTLDVQASLAIVEATRGFVDFYKIGQANYLKAITKTTDWRDFTLRMIDLCGRRGVKHYIKRDLQPHLPPLYPNPLRVPQHH